MRYAILSDIHGNLPALDAVLADLASQGADELIYLGDAVGYGPDSNAVIALLRKRVSHLHCRIDGHAVERQIWLPGNHEWRLLGRAERIAFNDEALVTLDRTSADLHQDSRALLADLPTKIEITLDGAIHATLVHAAPSEPVGIRNYIDHEIHAADEAKLFHGQICLVGHTHYPRIFRETNGHIGQHRVWEKIDAWEGVYSFAHERLILNPGSVGQPRDGDPRAAYALLDTTAHSFTVRRVTYDIGAAQARMRAWLGNTFSNLDAPEGLAGRLALGI
jgi:predicted phosphodiesterase